MQIHEITTKLTEGAWSDFGRGLASGLTGVNVPQSQASINQDAALAAQKLKAQGYRATQAPAATKRIVVSLMDPQQSLPTKYYKVGNIWTNETGAVITNPKSKAWLDGMIATHGKSEVIPTAAPQPTKKVSRRRGIK